MFEEAFFYIQKWFLDMYNLKNPSKVYLLLKKIEYKKRFF